jgi:hypothetical protein
MSSVSPAGSDEYEIDFAKIQVSHLALWLGEIYAWCNPQLAQHGDSKDGVEPASLAKARTFFLHVTLEHYNEIPQKKKIEKAPNERVPPKR